MPPVIRPAHNTAEIRKASRRDFSRSLMDDVDISVLRQTHPKILPRDIHGLQWKGRHRRWISGHISALSVLNFIAPLRWHLWTFTWLGVRPSPVGDDGWRRPPGCLSSGRFLGIRNIRHIHGFILQRRKCHDK
jgi:hypothetical protein